MPPEFCLTRTRCEKTGYSEANSRSFRQFHRFHGAENASTLPEEELEAAAESRGLGRGFDDSPLDARMLDLDDEDESPFLRGQKRVPVRRGALPRKAAGRIKLLLIVLLVAGVVGLVGVTLYRYGTQSWRFRIDSSDNIAVLGNQQRQRARRCSKSWAATSTATSFSFRWPSARNNWKRFPGWSRRR